LYPLPNGLHFTPAMSARAMLSASVKIVEIDMPYHERSGESKLRVAKDGVRFLKVILQAAFLYKPARPLGLVSLLLFLVAGGMMVQPTVNYLSHHNVEPWMIYRFMVSDLFGLGACLLFCASYLTDRIVSIALSNEAAACDEKWTARFFRSRWFWGVPALFIMTGAALVMSSVVERLYTGVTTEHWSRYVVMTFWVSIGLVLSVAHLIDSFLLMIADRLHYLRVLLPADLQPEEAVAGAAAGHMGGPIRIPSPGPSSTIATPF